MNNNGKSTSNIDQSNMTTKKEKKYKLSFLENFLVGGTSGAISKTVAAPLERVKLLIQNQIMLNDLSTKYNGNIDCIKRVYKEQGFLSFWRGNLANVVRYVPSFALNYSLKELVAKRLSKNVSIDSSKMRFILNNLLSGFSAASLSTIVTYPLDFARTKIGVDVHTKGHKKEYKGIIDCIVKNYKMEGIRGLYAGVFITIIGGSIYRGCYFGFYDSLKLYMPIETTNKLVFYLISVFLTGLAGIITLPFDTVRRRMMIQTGLNEKYYKGYLDCITKIFSKEGYRGFSKGGTANFLRSFGSAFTLVCNDYVIKFYKTLKI